MARTKQTSEAELRDAIKRMNEKPEAKYEAHNSKSWRDYLINILGINPNAVESANGKKFWENVREEINLQEQVRTGQETLKSIKRVRPTKYPTLKQLREHNAQIRAQVVYRDKYGHFASKDNPTATSEVLINYFNKTTKKYVEIT